MTKERWQFWRTIYASKASLPLTRKKASFLIELVTFFLNLFCFCISASANQSERKEKRRTSKKNVEDETGIRIIIFYLKVSDHIFAFLCLSLTDVKLCLGFCPIHWLKSCISIKKKTFKPCSPFCRFYNKDLR